MVDINTLHKFPWKPQPGPNIQSSPLTISADFGDGYTEIKPQGINNDLKTYQYTVRVPLSEKQRVADFLDYHGADKAFSIYSYARLKDIIVRLTTWTETPHIGAGYSDFAINFKEVVL